MNKLLRHIFIVSLMLGAGHISYAQGGGGAAFRNNAGQTQGGVRRPNVNKRLQAIKKSYMGQQLSLTPEQSARFWNKFDEYEEDYNAVLALRRENNQSPKPGNDQFEKDLFYQQQLTGIQKHYYEEFLKILPADKAGSVFKIEKQFNAEVVRRLKEIQVPK